MFVAAGAMLLIHLLLYRIEPAPDEGYGGRAHLAAHMRRRVGPSRNAASWRWPVGRQ